MAFNKYKSLSDTLLALQVHYTKEVFVIKPNTAIATTDFLQEEINFNLNEMPYNVSEASICELLISPVLRYVWRFFKDDLSFWIQKPIRLNRKLAGTPDYLFAKQSPLGKVVFEKPYIAVVEAKKDDFVQAWGQCLAEMYAMQQLNESDLPIYGIVSNGLSWSFGTLQKDKFTEFSNTFTIQDLPTLVQAIASLLSICSENIKKI